MTSAVLVSLANHLWQSTLFTAAVWLVTLILRSNAASLRHRLWLAASVKFLVPFSLLVGLGARLPLRTAPVTEPQPVSVMVNAIGTPFPTINRTDWTLQPLERPSSYLPEALAVLWFSGFAGCVGWWFRGWQQVRRALRGGVPLDLNIPVLVISSKERIEPGVFGVFRPVLLLPEGIVQRLTPDQMSAVVAHEMSHVRRRDNVANTIHMLTEALFWFHPLVWWMERRLLDEQERACDEEVLRRGGDPQVYAESILRICELYITSPLICVPGITGSDLRMRVREIMRSGVRPRLSVAGRLLLYMAALLALAGPVVVGVAVRAQTTATRGGRTFEVAAIKLSPVCKVGPGGGGSPGRIDLCGHLRDIIQQTYKRNPLAMSLLRPEVQGGPSWLDTDYYEIIAKAEGNPSRTQMLGPMLRALLEERFKLEVHRDATDVPVYFLTVAKSAPKLHPAKKGSCIPVDSDHPPALPAPGQSLPRICGGLWLSGERFDMYDATISSFCGALSARMNRDIIDKTGIRGTFDIHLDIVPDHSPSAQPADTGPLNPGLLAPQGDLTAMLRALARDTAQEYDGAIIPAIQNQLGLKVESGRGPGETLVINHIERPSSN